jgi:predicted ferric reductase
VVTPRFRRLFWPGLYVLLALLPLGAALAGDPFDTPRSWVIEFSIALGFIALALLTQQFALVSRLNAASRPFGGDALMQLHRRIAIVAFMFIVVHAVLVSASSGSWSAWSPFHGSTASRTGALALWTTLTVVATSLFRRRIRLSYEAWQLIHLSGACLIVGSALFHVFGVAGYSRSPLMRWTIGGYTALFATLLLRYRLVRPLVLSRRPWEIVANRDLGASTRLLRVRPLGHEGLRFDPGQFAWLITGSTPLWSQQHPVSIASSAESASRDGVEFAIKALGDWSSTAIPALAPGRRVWIDGPFGAFTPAGKTAHGLVLIAGGIGIAPMRSMLMSMRDRADARPNRAFLCGVRSLPRAVPGRAGATAR